MTKTDRNTVSCAPKATGDQDNCSPGETESPKDSDQTPRGYPGTIPKLIITRDPSPTRSQETPALLSTRTTELSTGSCLDPHPDDESPCSDSGCGGSPALMRSPRKLSNSSSIGLSSASSFEESEDDFTGSDIESSLSPARSLCSPDDGTGVSVLLFFFFFHNKALLLSVCVLQFSDLYEVSAVPCYRNTTHKMQILNNKPYIMADIQYVVKEYSSAMVSGAKLLHSC